MFCGTSLDVDNFSEGYMCLRTRARYKCFKSFKRDNVYYSLFFLADILPNHVISGAELHQLSVHELHVFQS